MGCEHGTDPTQECRSTQEGFWCFGRHNRCGFGQGSTIVIAIAAAAGIMRIIVVLLLGFFKGVGQVGRCFGWCRE
eukprot:scaffold822_cov130-Cylindrotheca_fusiformis.AAC.6